jgi:hypothetical protein
MTDSCFGCATRSPPTSPKIADRAESAQGDREHSTGELDASGVSEAPESCKQ